MKVMRVLVGLVGVGIIVIVIDGYLRRDDKPAATPVLDQSGQGVSTTAEVLTAEYSSNEVTADEKFKDHEFGIKGTVLAVTRDDDSDHPIVLLDSGHPDVVVTARLRAVPYAEGLQRGAVARLYCVGTGISKTGPMLRRCITY
jgi:hypothetical protein